MYCTGSFTKPVNVSEFTLYGKCVLNIFSRIINDLAKEKLTTFSKLYYDLTIEIFLLFS